MEKLQLLLTLRPTSISLTESCTCAIVLHTWQMTLQAIAHGSDILLPTQKTVTWWTLILIVNLIIYLYGAVHKHLLGVLEKLPKFFQYKLNLHAFLWNRPVMFMTKSGEAKIFRSERASRKVCVASSPFLKVFMSGP